MEEDIKLETGLSNTRPRPSKHVGGAKQKHTNVAIDAVVKLRPGQTSASKSPSQKSPGRRTAPVAVRGSVPDACCKNTTRSQSRTKAVSIRPIIPAKKAELVSVARQMNREQFGPRLKKLFDPETEAATEAIQTGIYIGWRCSEFTWDCIRVGRESRCFCDHLLKEHAPYNGHSVRVPCGLCRCQAFAFIPGRPEDIGEFWFQRRRDFDPTAWRAKCRCKHTHVDHDSTGLRRCKLRSCNCGAFSSNFLCAACDRHWEQHETVFETESHRHQNNIPYGEAYLPFAEMPDLRNMALTGVDDDPGCYRSLVDGKGSIPRNRQRAIDQNTPVKPEAKGGFTPVWD